MGRRRTPRFHTPFAEAEAKLRAKLERGAEAPTAAAGARDTGAAAPPEDGAAGDEDARLFSEWVGPVRPVGGRGRRTPARTPPRAPHLAEDEEAEVVRVLRGLVEGEGPVDPLEREEAVEALAPGVDRRLLERLKRGEIAVEAHLDLHGLRREEARDAVRQLFREAHRRGQRCLRIVHGRGRRSAGGEPVLKPALVRWLSRGALAREVLCFCSAPRYDGGTGALYVLLRR
ncbi:MAG: DNA mismatch repair protein MutS [Deltaproteobacteria bacterium]|nr:MAG: DNA mismatch repair protein MutS [Deltaproteobacteria bacterium]